MKNYWKKATIISLKKENKLAKLCMFNLEKF